MSNSEGVSRNGSGEQHIRDDEFFENDPNAARFRDMARRLLGEGESKENVRKTLGEYGADDTILDRIFRTKEYDQPLQQQQLQQQAQGNAGGEGGSRQRENEVREAALRLAEIREKGNKGTQFLRDLKKQGFAPEEIAQIDVAAGEPIKKQRKQGSASQPVSQKNTVRSSEESNPNPTISAADTQHLRELMEKIIDTDALFTALREDGWQDEKIFRTISALKDSMAVESIPPDATQPVQSASETHEADPARPDPAAQQAERLRKKKEREAMTDNAYWIIREKKGGRSIEEITKKLVAAQFTQEVIEKTFKVATAIEDRNAKQAAFEAAREKGKKAVEILAAAAKQREEEAATGAAHERNTPAAPATAGGIAIPDVDTSEEVPVPGQNESGGDVEESLALTSEEEVEEQEILARAAENRRMADSVPEEFEAPELLEIRKSYDPLFRLLKEMAEDPAVNFSMDEAEKVGPEYLVAKPFLGDNGEIDAEQESVQSYHDLLRLRSSIPEDVLAKSDALEWTWDADDSWSKVMVIANKGGLWDRLQDPKDPLSKYNDRFDSLLDEIGNESLSDEYAQAVLRGDIQLPRSEGEKHLEGDAARVERLTAREIEDLKRSYDPMFRLLKRMSEDPEVDFKAEDAHLNYGVFIPFRDEKGNLTGKAEGTTSYHDLMQLRATIPDELRRESDPLVWKWEGGSSWGKITTFANGPELWDRLNNPDDKLSKYRDEVYALIEQIKDERLPDEYAEAVARGEVNVQEIPEWNVWGAYSELRAMYNGEPIPEGVEQKYDSIRQRVREAQLNSDEMRAATTEMRAFVQEQWSLTVGQRAASTLDYDDWLKHKNTFEDQYNDFDLIRLFPKGKYPHSVGERMHEYRNEFVKALNAGDEAKMAEITATADAFFAEQRNAAERGKEDKDLLPLSDIEEIVREKLKGEVEIKELQITEAQGGLQIQAKLKQGMAGNIELKGLIINRANSIDVEDVEVKADRFEGTVRSRIEENLSGFGPAIKKYFEEKYGKPVLKMQVGGTGLALEFERSPAAAAPAEPAKEAKDEQPGEDEDLAVSDIDSRAEGVSLLKKTVEAAKGKLYEAKEKVKWWKSSEEHLIRRSAELDAQAEKMGGVERLFRGMGEKYNKLPFKYKVALGATVGLGAIATAGSLAMALPLLGIAGQRIAGLSTMYLKYEKQYHDEAWKNNKDWGKQKALLLAGVYTVALGLTMKEAIEMASETQLAHAAQAKVDGWLSSVFGNQSPAEAPKTPPAAPPPAPSPAPVASAAPSAAVASAPAAPQATAPEVAASQPAPEATGAEPAATPPPAEAAPAQAASAQDTAGTKPTEAAAAQPAAAAAAGETSSAGTPEVASIEVKATPGKGYEYMTKRLWEQLQEKNIKLPSGANPDSDLARLLAADKDSIDTIVHELAQENEFFKSTGQSVRIDLDSHMTIDAKGNISITGNDLAPEGTNLAPEGSPLTPPYQPGAPHPEAPAPVPPTPDIPVATEGPAGIAGTTATETTVEQFPSSDILIENQSPAPVIERDFVVNKFDITVPIAEPHIYAGPPGTTTVFAYGGEKMVRLNAMFEYLKTHPDSTVIAEDDSGKYRAAWTLVKDRLVQGERLPQSGFFGKLSGAFLPPPGPDELSKLIK